MAVKNSAVVFIKPHANTERGVMLVENYLERNGITIVKKSHIKVKKLQFLIDEHYTVLSSGAYCVSPKDIPIEPNKKLEFAKTFNETWELACEEGRVINVKEYFALKGDDSAENLRQLWDTETTLKLRISDGVTLGCIKLEANSRPYYVLNAFYAALKSKFTQPSSSVTAFVCEFDPRKLSWRDFRTKLIGASNPEKAPKTSLRRIILDNWRTINLRERPNMGNNGVHASAGPLEGLRERLLWFGDEITLDNDDFALELQKNDITDLEIQDFFSDFDLFEETKEMSSSRCIDHLLSRIKDSNSK